MSRNHAIQAQAYRLVFDQFIGVLTVCALAFILSGLLSASSVFYGGVAYTVANLIFVWGVFRFSGAKQMQQFAAAFMLGETLKLVGSAILILLIVKYLPHSLLSVLVGYIVAIMSFWIACIFRFTRQVRNEDG